MGITVQADDKPVAAGFERADSEDRGDGDALLVRLTTTGAADTGFGTSGKSETLGSDRRFEDVVIAANGDLIASGRESNAPRFLARYCAE